MGDSEAHGVGYQLNQPWPPPDTPGIVTTAGRTFHRGEDCPGYQQGVRNSVKYGRAVQPIEHVTAREAKRRGKAACGVCWRS